MIRLAEVFGEREVFPRDAVDLMSKWFERDDIIVVTSMTPVMENATGGRPRVESIRITAEKFVKELLSKDGYAKFQALTHGVDLYFALAPSSEAAKNSRRLLESETDCVIGVYCDLDVKPGCFESQDQAMQFLSGLLVRPSFVVATGSGGLHGYWKLDQRVSVTEGKELTKQWWTYLQKEAKENYNVDIDRLVDVTRMFRIPGSLRYPKAPGEIVRQVRLTVQGDRTVDPVTLRRVAAEAVEEREEMIKEVRDRERVVSSPTVDLNDSDSPWANIVAVGQVEEWANTIEWDAILNQLGWTFLREDSSGRKEWARPGARDKSCVVDWPQSPHVMSLLSTSRETNLSDLQEAGVVLTKWRVILRLFFNDNSEQALAWAKEQMTKGD